MSIVDDKGRLFGKINIIDILVALVILVSILGLTYKFTKSKTITPFTKPNKIQLQLYGEEVSDFIIKNIKLKDAVKDYEKGAKFGTITDFKIDKAFSIGQNSDGQLVQTTRPGCSSIKITVEGTGVYEDNGISIDNVEYFVGKIINLRAGDSIFTVRIYDIEKKG